MTICFILDIIKMYFEKFYNKLLNETVKSKKISVFWETENVIWMASYKTLNWLEYTKIVLADESFLYIVPWDKEVYYSTQYIVDTYILDDDVWTKKILTYNWKKYKLENKDDYQYVTQLYIGDINTIEWECVFSDYIPEEWKDFLSLWWVVANEERADINPSLISIEDIKII